MTWILKSSPPNPTNVWPISLLLIPEKIFKKELVKNIGSSFSSRFDSRQYGYRRLSFTTCALIDVEKFLMKGLQEKKVSACYILAVYLAKGFDKVSHRILLQKC